MNSKSKDPNDGNTHDEDLHILEIHPIYRYEHGNVVYKRGNANGFDYSNCGFYIVTANSIAGTIQTPESIAKFIDAELEIYSKWCNGEVYQFELYDDAGKLIEAMGGFYDLDEIRDELPEDYKDEDLEQYLQI